jgi:hypothetical protein
VGKPFKVPKKVEQTVEKANLLHCPCCGVDPNYRKVSNAWVIDCPRCGLGLCAPTLLLAMERWNRRYIPLPRS